DAGAEQAVTLGLERAVVDRFRLLDLAEGPRADLLWRSQGDADLVEGRGGDHRIEDVQDFLVHEISRPAVNSGSDGEELTAPPLPIAMRPGRDQLCSSSTFRPKERISLTSTLKLSGMPASKVSSPRTMDS